MAITGTPPAWGQAATTVQAVAGPWDAWAAASEDKEEEVLRDLTGAAVQRGEALRSAVRDGDLHFRRTEGPKAGRCRDEVSYSDLSASQKTLMPGDLHSISATLQGLANMVAWRRHQRVTTR